MSNKSNFSIVELGSLDNVRAKESFGTKGKFFLGEQLGITGCEISLGIIPAGQAVPFLHAHKENEEIYIFIKGTGIFSVDGEKMPVKEGSIIKVAPSGMRGLKASSEDLHYICVQSKENSLKQATMDDGIISEEQPSW